MRAILVLVALLALSGAASAQTSPSLTVTLADPEEALTSEDPIVQVVGTMKLVSEATAMTFSQGVQVSYSVVAQPDWVAVTIDPPLDVVWMQTSLPGMVEGSRTFTVTIVRAPNATSADLAEIEIEARSSSNPFVRSATGTAAMVVASDAATPCGISFALAGASATPIATGAPPLALALLGLAFAARPRQNK